MASAHAQRVRFLQEMQGGDAREHALLTGDVLDYGEWETAASGSTFLVVFKDDTVAFHKRHDKLSSQNVHRFGHSLDTPPIHECAAWHFAKALGPEFEALLPVTVYRRLYGAWGSLALQLPGKKPGAVAYTKVPEQVNAAGLFDVLIGQQDRHLNNFVWDASSQRLGLFDHGFCFPKAPSGIAGDPHRIRTAKLQEQRRWSKPRLDDAELRLVRRVLESGDLLGIAPLLEPERAARMEARLLTLLEPPHVIPKREAT